MAKLRKKLARVCLGHVDLEVFNTHLVVIGSHEDRAEYLRLLGVEDAAGGGVARALEVSREDGGLWFIMTLTDAAGVPEVAHEAVHVADWLMERRDIPSCDATSEVRAYLVGYMVREVLKVLSAAGRGV